MRKLYFQLSEEFLDRLATVAHAERRDPRRQATVCLEMGISLLERQYGLASPDLPPQVIDVVYELT